MKICLPLLFLIVCVTLLGCFPFTNPLDPESANYRGFWYSWSIEHPDVCIYIGGSIHDERGVEIPGYWKNGVWNELPPFATGSSRVTSLLLQGGQLFVGGYTNPGQTTTPGYWQDGVPHALASLPAAKWANVNSLVATDGDLYAGGSSSVEINTSTAGYWKNGSWTSLPKASGWATLEEVHSILLSGSDLYAGGVSGTSGFSTSIPGYWKNDIWHGLPTIVPSDSSNQVYELAISGSDLYAAGYCQNGDGVFVPGYWKNDVWNPLPVLDAAKHSSVSSLFLDGSDVYVAGYSTNSSDDRIPGYWKNGSWNSAPMAGSYAEATDIVVSRDDVFVCGNNPGSYPLAGCWINGVWRQLPLPRDSLSSSRAASILIDN